MLTEYLKNKSDEIRQKTIDYHRKTKIPHVGCDLSAVEILTTLHYGIMKEQDSFILGKGHACGVYYIILNEKGLIPDKELDRLEEHPTLNKSYGIEATTGSLGHGLSIGLGMALANKKNNVYVLMGDGECDEGQIWEAAKSASELKTKNLVGIVDCNGWQAFKRTDHKKLDAIFSAFGWETLRCDGHDCNELYNALNKTHNLPFVVLAETIKGKGIPEIENTLKSHYVSK